MKYHRPKHIPDYKIATYLLFAGLLLFLASVFLSSWKVRILCCLLWFAVFACTIWKILLPLYRLHTFFRNQSVLSEESLPPGSTECDSINAFLQNSYLKTRQIQSALSDQNIDSLSRQINFHFFYQTLESIRGRAFCDGADLVADMIEALSSFFRYSISQKGNVVSIQDELQNLNSYMKIQMFRFGNRFSYEVSLDSDMLKKYQIPKLTLQPIVENSIVHGIENYENGGMISVSAFETDQSIVIHIKDNGVGIPAEQLRMINLNFQNNYFESFAAQKRHLNIALTNINNRICLLYGNQYHLHIFSTENLGTDVQITLPKILHLKEIET